LTEVTLANALRLATTALHALGDTARLDAELLVAAVAQLPRSTMLAFPERTLSTTQAAQLAQWIEQRKQHIPLAYLLGEREFWSLRCKVTPATLIPRPETELLVEHALQLIPTDAHWHLADLGTGSGAIALALAQERPHCTVIAADISAEALAVARANQQLNHIDNITFIQSNWFANVPLERFHIIVSNPPYLAEHDPHLQQGDIQHEPRQALVAGATGLEAIQLIAAQSRSRLHPGGWLILEHGYDQGDTAAQCLRATGYQHVTTRYDLAGQARICLGQQPKDAT
jgi:release factor glutamine methyltransferase